MNMGKLLPQTNQATQALWLAAIALAVLAGPASGAAAGAAKRYALAEGGFLQLAVPAGWNDELDRKAQPPVISLRQGKGQPFLVSLTPVPQAGPGKRAASKAELRAEVATMADAIRLFAVEKDIKLKEFAGTAGPGYYFFATDAAPAPGEFKFMHRGMLRVGELTVTFTILTNPGQDGIVRAALAMLKSAAHVAR